MANNYTQTSFFVPLSDVQIDWCEMALRQAEECCDEPEGTAINCDDADIVALVEGWRESGYQPYVEACRSDQNGVSGLWFSNGPHECVDLWFIAELLCGLTHKFPEIQPVGLMWADTCSKPRIDGFSGGAIVVWKGEAEWHNAETWLDKAIEARMVGAISA